MARPGTFVKGDPRINRKGRTKKGESIAEKFRDAMAERFTEDGYTKLDSMIDMVVKKAMQGNIDAIEFCIARGFGKLIERIETSNTNKNYDFSNLSMEERVQLSELLKRANTTVPSDNSDTE